MALVTFNGAELANATFNGSTINKITFDGTTIWENSVLLSFAKAGVGVGTLPAAVRVKKGSTVTIYASSGIGSSTVYIRYTAPGASITTRVDMPITVIPSGDQDFGYIYYSYSWNKSTFTINEDTTITLTGTQIDRVYTISASANTGLYFSNGSDSITISNVPANSQ